MRLQREEIAAARRFPDDDATGTVARRQKRTIGAVSSRGDPVGVFGEIVQFLPSLERIHAHGPLRPAERHEPLVGAHVGGENDVEFVTERANSPTALHTLFQSFRCEVT